MVEQPGHDARIAVVESKVDDLRESVEEIKDELKRLNNWQRWVLGAGTGIGAVIALGYRAIADWWK